MSELKLIGYAFPRWLLKTAIVFFVVAALISFAGFSFEKKYENKIYPGVYAGGINLAGLTAAEAAAAINEKINFINQDGIKFYYGGKHITIYPIISSATGDIALQIIGFDAAATAEKAVAFGRNGYLLNDWKNKFSSLRGRRDIKLSVDINQGEIEKIFAGGFSEFNIPAEDAKLIYNPGADGEPVIYPSFSIETEKTGKIIDYQRGMEQLEKNILNLDSTPIKLNSKTAYPLIYKKNCLNIEAEAEAIMSLAPLTLSAKDARLPDGQGPASGGKIGEKKWKIEKEVLAGWLTLAAADNEKNRISVGLNPEIIKNYLQNNIAAEINKKAEEARFEVKDGRVVEFRSGNDGIELKIEENFEIIKNGIKDKKNEIELATKEIKNSVTAEEINNFGIKEIVGTGESSFAGSPANRRHNIKVGAESLNGILIKADEEFSLLKALGAVDDASGYLPELVIKDDKTTPEYGGGLCQIGTTVFRSALASGLPITARRNHSYRVSYYEPAGTDATIYDPAPDLKFINDTGKYILIQSRIEGNNLYFDFWGTKDGRISERTKPVIYNIVKPGPAKIIETLDLKPGEKKCTEKPHNGADAYFDHKIIYPNGDVKEKRYSSHYIPWREVCLIGVEKLTEPASNPDAETASSTTTNATNTPDSNMVVR